MTGKVDTGDNDYSVVKHKLNCSSPELITDFLSSYYMEAYLWRVFLQIVTFKPTGFS